MVVNTSKKMLINCIHTGEATIILDKENTKSCSLTFTVEEVMRYSVGFEEGYDLYDERYESWLKINHPNAATNAVSPCTAVSELQRTPPSSTQVVYRLLQYLTRL